MGRILKSIVILESHKFTFRESVNAKRIAVLGQYEVGWARAAGCATVLACV
jgi:hypothetical protein